MEQYFDVVKIRADEQVNITTMYLLGDVKLWWRTRIKEDINTRRSKIETWDHLKQQLKEQFLPNNLSWLTRKDLNKLKQDWLLRDYIKEFISLILNIKNIFEEDRLFNFM